MDPKDKPKFVELLSALGEMYGKNVTPALLGIYWEALKDLPFEQVRKNINAYINNPENTRFPLPPQLRDVTGGADDETLRMIATEDFNLVKELLLEYYDPYMHSCMLTFIKMQLERKGKGYLWDYVTSYGNEILEIQNLPATRSQFVKQLVQEVKAGKIDRQTFLAAGKPRGELKGQEERAALTDGGEHERQDAQEAA